VESIDRLIVLIEDALSKSDLPPVTWLIVGSLLKNVKVFEIMNIPLANKAQLHGKKDLCFLVFNSLDTQTKLQAFRVLAELTMPDSMEDEVITTFTAGMPDNSREQICQSFTLFLWRASPD
jgi:hypothetical protein